MPLLNIYQKLLRRKYRRYGNMIAHAKEIESTNGPFTQKDVLKSVTGVDRRNVLRVFHHLGLIKTVGTKRRRTEYLRQPVLTELINYIEGAGMKKFSLGPYDVLIDLDFLNTYLMPSQLPVIVIPTENIGENPAKLFHQIVVMGQDGSKILYLHIMGMGETSLPFVGAEPDKPDFLSWIEKNIEISKIENAFVIPDKIGNVFCYTVMGVVRDGENISHIFRTFWSPFVRVEENVVKGETVVMSSFIGLIPTGQLLKTARVEKRELK